MKTAIPEVTQLMSILPKLGQKPECLCKRRVKVISDKPKSLGRARTPKSPNRAGKPEKSFMDNNHISKNFFFAALFGVAFSSLFQSAEAMTLDLMGVSDSPDLTSYANSMGRGIRVLVSEAIEHHVLTPQMLGVDLQASGKTFVTQLGLKTQILQIDGAFGRPELAARILPISVAIQVGSANSVPRLNVIGASLVNLHSVTGPEGSPLTIDFSLFPITLAANGSSQAIEFNHDQLIAVAGYHSKIEKVAKLSTNVQIVAGVRHSAGAVFTEGPTKLSMELVQLSEENAALGGDLGVRIAEKLTLTLSASFTEVYVTGDHYAPDDFAMSVYTARATYKPVVSADSSGVEVSAAVEYAKVKPGAFSDRSVVSGDADTAIFDIGFLYRF